MPPKSEITKISWIPLPRIEKSEVLLNPYCGFYAIYRFFADSEKLQPEGAVIEGVTVESSHQLCLIEINLLHFNEKPLSKDSLQIVKRIFEHFTVLRKQMIIRFVYDWEGKGIVNEPKDISIVLNHMNQLSPLLKDYTNSIYILQGLFIGSWGEMHGSRYLSERSMSHLAKQLYDCSGEKTQIALRCPNFWRMLFQTNRPLDKFTAFTDIQRARFSLFNDGMMASENDFGTYGSISAMDSKHYSDKWVRLDELDFQNELCKYVSNGGEVINECKYNDALPAIETLRKMRVSYLHNAYDEKVLNKWKVNRSGADYILWKDRTAYEYIAAHLGYRFTIEDADMTLLSGKGCIMRASVKISNLGFAPCYHKFIVKFVVRTATYINLKEYMVDTDTRMWMPGEKVEIQAIIPAIEWEQKNYILCIGISDPNSMQQVRIANTFSAPDYNGVYSIGNFSIYR